MVEEQENLDDYGCPIIRNPVDPKVDEEIWICSRYPFRLKTTLHSVGAEGEYALWLGKAASEVVNFLFRNVLSVST